MLQFSKYFSNYFLPVNRHNKKMVLMSSPDIFSGLTKRWYSGPEFFDFFARKFVRNLQKDGIFIEVPKK